MISSIPLDELGQRCDSLRKQVHEADGRSLSSSVAIRTHSAMVMASTYVWVTAALEEFVRRELTLLVQAITAQAVPVADVRRSLLALTLNPKFDGLRQLSGLRMWERRAELLENTLDLASATFHPDVHPVDRKTLKAEHFKTIWRVCGLPGTALPSPRHELALRELARFRNELAHGRVDPVTFGRGKTAVDTLRAVQTVEDVAEHFHVSAESYLSVAGYRR